ncbi:MAG: GFA family protein [Rhodospirillales bacterium]|nr:GFA family protein [Rhodospirillales bacterium]
MTGNAHHEDNHGANNTGGCLCGAVRYTVTGAMREVVACHCGQCQRMHGNFAAYSACDTDRLGFDTDEGLTWFRASDTAQRGFCRHCGSSLFWKPDFADYVAVSAGTLDQPTNLRLAKHIFTADKPDWYEICDGLTRHEGSSFGRDA